MSASDHPPANTAPLFLVLDRVVDGRWAVLEPDGGADPAKGSAGTGAGAGAGDEAPHFLTLPIGWLPAGVQEGDVLRAQAVAGARDAQVTLVRDDEARGARAERLAALRQAIPRGPSGDITL